MLTEKSFHMASCSWLALSFSLCALIANIRALIEHVLLVPASFLVGQQLSHADLVASKFLGFTSDPSQCNFFMCREVFAYKIKNDT